MGPVRLFSLIVMGLSGLSGQAVAEAVTYPAPDGSTRVQVVVYSTLDQPLAAPLIAGFQAQHPDVTVRYEDLLADQIATRVRAETDAGGPSADFVFSSAMDVQMKLANDGYAQPVALRRDWPVWARWQDMAYALTLEPAVVVYHKPSFPDGPPQSRLAILDWLAALPKTGAPRVGTYDIAASAVGYLFMARDADRFPDVWGMLAAMARAGLQTYPTSQDIIDRVADGRLLLGYNILGSYAADQARVRPDLGLVLLRDYTVVISRVGLVPRAAARPDLGRDLLAWLASDAGQTVLSDRLRLPSVSLGVTDAGGEGSLSGLGAGLQPVPVSPGVMAYLDQANRARLLRTWAAALSGDAAALAR
ncbi:iron(III) transport system substrate-binding protein [Loktanella fryxellensis]|uniref:Iron(III) transport system substrate-binding protein n=1 Tax=Loktanella fryxellensis TaxID=245187 RepID=A0A1H8BSF7_9RHOB|nr:ABC transporter substrate-binding protein [Loktanella fryxellensis]SEM85733.1 iron(III) transport system substrate-binding protein [Loktanella fryxellensis]